jgi:predicted transcriptional regulator
MPSRRRKSKQAEKPSVLKDVAEQFAAIMPAIDELKSRMKEEKKKLSGIYKTVKEHMEQENLETLTIDGGYVFQRTINEQCRFTEKNLMTLLEDDHSLVEKYKETFTTNKPSFNCKRNA